MATLSYFTSNNMILPEEILLSLGNFSKTIREKNEIDHSVFVNSIASGYICDTGMSEVTYDLSWRGIPRDTSPLNKIMKHMADNKIKKVNYFVKKSRYIWFRKIEYSTVLYFFNKFITRDHYIADPSNYFGKDLFLL